MGTEQTWRAFLCAILLLFGCGRVEDSGRQERIGRAERVERACATPVDDAGICAAPAEVDAGAPECKSGPPVIDPTPLSRCCEESPRAHCMPTSLVPTAQQADLDACSGNYAPTGFCVPDKMIIPEGEFVPQRCSTFGTMDIEGRCMSKCVAMVRAEASLLSQEDCDADELCAPCYDPRNLQSTGVCNLSCDHPSDPPRTFVDCCLDRASCVPTSFVPDNMLDHVKEDSCNADQRCVPKELVADPEYQPPPCVGKVSILTYTGVCLSTCLALPAEANQLGPGNCAPGDKCIPCVNPLTGQPTGAPGC